MVFVSICTTKEVGEEEEERSLQLPWASQQSRLQLASGSLPASAAGPAEGMSMILIRLPWGVLP